MQSFIDDLQANNDAVSASFVPLSQARGLRDQLLYQGDNSVVNTAQLVKEYVKGAFGTQSLVCAEERCFSAGGAVAAAVGYFISVAAFSLTAFIASAG